MKKLLLATDFSDSAKNAVVYGYGLAKQIKANITICNAFTAPAAMPQAGNIVWPMEDFETSEQNSSVALQTLKDNLAAEYPEGYQPNVNLVNEMGNVVDVIDDITSAHDIDFIIMGTHGNSNLSSLIMGNHSRQMIDAATKPLLLVPPMAKFKGIKKIAYATDFKNPQDDLAAIYELIRFAKLMDAEILLTHVLDEKYQSPSFKKWLDDLLTDLSNKADYPNIYYRVIKNGDTGNGLDWLCEHGVVDILTMLHRQHNFFDSLLKGSFTQKMANHISIPLLVYPQTRK